MFCHTGPVARLLGEQIWTFRFQHSFGKLDAPGALPCTEMRTHSCHWQESYANCDELRHATVQCAPVHSSVLTVLAHQAYSCFGKNFVHIELRDTVYCIPDQFCGLTIFAHEADQGAIASPSIQKRVEW